MQPPLHSSVPTGHTQVLVTQLWPGRHAFGQLPQWLASFARSTQAPPQLTRPPVQVSAQAPLLQTSFALQSFPQPPQFFGSVLWLTQLPLHDESGDAQAQALF
jgi:hypothetical protein